MVQEEKAGTALFVMIVLLIIGVRYLSHFPGTVALGRLVQGITPASKGWAQ